MVRGNGPSFAASVRLSWPFQMGFTVLSYPPTTPIHTSTKSTDIYHIFSYPHTTPIYISSKSTDIHHIFSYPPTTPIHSSIKSADIYCPASRTTLVARRFRVAVICPIIQVPHCIRVFFYFVWFVFINHIFQFYYELCTYCNILDIYLS